MTQYQTQILANSFHPFTQFSAKKQKLYHNYYYYVLNCNGTAKSKYHSVYVACDFRRQYFIAAKGNSALIHSSPNGNNGHKYLFRVP